MRSRSARSLLSAGILSLGAACCQQPDTAAQDLESHATAALASAGSAPRPSAAGLPEPLRCSCTSIERCEAGRCVPACPTGEVYVPATGPAGFVAGLGTHGKRDQPHRVVLTRPFCVDATEVTVAAYRECVEQRACPLPQLGDINSNYRYGAERADHPVNQVNFEQATFFCASLGKQLPTEAQWLWAAGHGDGRKYPWGAEEPTCENGLADFTPEGSPKTDPAGDVGCHGGGTSPVKAHPRGKSSWPSGDLFDLGGNVWEWTRDCYVDYPSEDQVDPSPQVHPALRDSCFVRTLLGGGWNRSKMAMQVGWRAGSKWTYRVPGLGFRCVREPG